MSTQSLLSTFYKKLAKKITLFPWRMLLVSLFLVIVCLIYTGKNLTFKTSRADLSDPTYPASKLYRAYLEDFRPSEALVVMAQSPHPGVNQQVIEFIATALNEYPSLYEGIFYKVSFDFLKGRELQYADLEKIKKIEETLYDLKNLSLLPNTSIQLEDWIYSISVGFDLTKLKKKGINPQEWKDLDGFGRYLGHVNNYLKRENFTPPPKTFFPSNDLDASFFSSPELPKDLAKTQYNTLSDGRIYLLLTSPIAQDKGFDPYKNPIETLQAIITEAHLKFPDVDIGLTGEPILDSDEIRLSRSDGTKAAVISFVVIILIFIIGFREILKPLLVTVFLVMAIILSLGWATLAIGHLNILTVAFVSMLLGLGIDYGIHLLGRFQEERYIHNKSFQQSIEVALSKTGVGVTEGAITTSVAFFCMMISDFRGIQELGIITGGGILLIALVMLIFMPSGLCLLDKWTHKKHKSLQHPQKLVLEFHTSPKQKPSLVWGACVILILGIVLFGWGLRQAQNVKIDYNLLNLQDPSLDSVKYEHILAQENASSTMFAVAKAKNKAEAKRKTDKFKNLSVVRDVINLYELFPDQLNEKTPLIKNIRSLAHDPAIKVFQNQYPVKMTFLKKTLQKLTKRIKLILNHGDDLSHKEALILQNLSRQVQTLRTRVELDSLAETKLNTLNNVRGKWIEDQLSFLQNQSDTPLEIKDLPESLQNRYFSRDGSIILEVYPNTNIWERENLEDFVLQIRTVDPDTIGTPVLNYDFIRIIMRGFRQTAIWAGLAIFVIVFLQFRSFLLTALAFFPLLFGLSWSVGMMSLFNIPLNPANIMVLPLVIGVGIDNGIHIVHRFHESRWRSIFQGSTGRCVLISCLTTMAGFASLNIAHHRGLASIGLLMCISIGAILVASLTVLPACLLVLNTAASKKSGQQKIVNKS